MRLVKVLLAIALLVGLSACGDPKFRRYNGPEVTSLQVHKGARKLYLLHDDKVLKQYDVSLGTVPVGHKEFEGDGKTPEGKYYIDRQNPNSRYHLSIGISYPNEADKVHASSMGMRPGGDIMIHGRTDYKGINQGDWTAGCIAVKDREMEEIYSMVRKGTIIYILP